MHAYLVTGNQEEYVSGLKGKKVEIPFAKVADLKELNNFTKLKLSEPTAIVLRDFDKSTTEAQNAFLKPLEEPQENLIYVLTATNLQNVLPTIISRCEVIEVKKDKEKLSNDDEKKAEEFINGKVGERLKIISLINKREDAISFLEKLIIYGHELFLNNPSTLSFLDSANKTLRNIEANGNTQLQLTNFVVLINK